MSKENQKHEDAQTRESKNAPPQDKSGNQPEEKGGRGGLDPVRYGDWEIGGKCVDF